MRARSAQETRRRKPRGPLARPGSTVGATIGIVAKISVSLDDKLYEDVRDAAGPAGVSSWLADAATARLRAEALQAVAAEIADTTGGPYSEDELSEARAW